MATFESEDSSSSSAANTNMQRLSMIETLSLLDSERRVSTWAQMEALYDCKDKEERKGFVDGARAWAKQIGHYVKVECRAAHDNKKAKKGEFTADPTALAMPFASMELDNAESEPIKGKLMPQKLAKVRKDERMFDRWPLLPKKTDADIVSCEWACAVSRIGHTVLLADNSLLPGTVLMPGLCPNDAIDADKLASAPQPTKDDKGLPLFTDLTQVSKKDLDTHALVVVPREPIGKLAATYDAKGTGPDETHDVMRVVRVERIQLTLADYVATLERELVTAGQDTLVKRRDMIVARIERLLAIAKSYYTEGATPANPNVLGGDGGRCADPSKVLLDMHMYTKYTNKALKQAPELCTVFNEVTADGIDKGSAEWQTAEQRGALNAHKVYERKNRCEYKLEIALRVKGTTEHDIKTHRYIRYTISVPIVNDYVWLSLLAKNKFRTKALTKPPAKTSSPSSKSKQAAKEKAPANKPTEDDEPEPTTAGDDMKLDEPAPTEQDVAKESSVADTSKKVKSAAEAALAGAEGALWQAAQKDDTPADDDDDVDDKKSTDKIADKSTDKIADKKSTPKTNKRKRDESESEDVDDDQLHMHAFDAHNNVQNELLQRMIKFEKKTAEKRAAGKMSDAKLYGALADYTGGAIDKQCDELMRNVFYFCNKTGFSNLFSRLNDAESELDERRKAKRARTAPAPADDDDDDDSESSGFN